MATKPQAKTAIDNSVVIVKDIIDNKLPTGVNIRKGSLAFAPNAYSFILDAGGSLTTAISWRDTILANYSLPPTSASFARRIDDGEVERAIVITVGTTTIKIVNFPPQ